MRIVDAHHHLWDPGVVDYALFRQAPRLAAVTAPHRAHDFDAVARASGISEAVAVEAASAGADPVEETRWLFGEVARSSVTRRVVAYAPVERPDIEAYLVALKHEHPALAGVRRTFETAAPGYAFSDAIVSGVHAVARAGLPFDLVLFADRLSDAVELVRRAPEATFVLDHLGKPRLERRVPDEWKATLAALAKLPNVVAKVSGLVTEAPDGRWDAALVRPYVDHAVACFGWQRLMFGSDWPICDLAGGYARWLDFAREVAATASAAEREAFFCGTADRVYRAAAA
ncbi:MAG TPA: amidohydrolase family protein [Bauldia sp.]|nr:amidohydrolase family protein [Bauldia sp.]